MKRKAIISGAIIDSLLAYLPRFEIPSVRHYELTTKLSLDPYAYSLDVDEFVTALYETGFIYEFDWPTWLRSEGRQYLLPGALAEADLETLRKLLTAHVRQDRFCSGHLASILDSGHFVEILRRLGDLREEMGEDDGNGDKRLESRR